MASGRLAATQTSTGVETIVYTVPAGKLSSFTVNICNTSVYDITVQYIALAASSSAAISEYIEYNVVLTSGSIIERTGLVLDATKNVIVKTSGPATVTVYGYEE